MPRIATARSNGKTKKVQLAEEIAKAVGAGKPVSVETVDFNDPNRPRTCLEVDFPIIPINQISLIEGNAGKPIYQMSKWWARRRSSVFRSMLLAASMKAPENPSQAAKAVWDVYYANHQKMGAFKHLKVADIFMGGGTTIVEGSRLGMQMYGCDLNPVAWFIVQNETAKVDPAEVESLLNEIEAVVKPQIMPFYTCDCPRGHKGKWIRVSTGEVMGPGFDALALKPGERKAYRYQGPEIIYVFWTKHGPCQVTGCGHRTPIMSSPVIAIKTLTVKAWEDFRCEKCRETFDVEDCDARMAPGVPLLVPEGERRYTVLEPDTSVRCPECGYVDRFPKLDGKGTSKKINLTLLVHPDWMRGAAGETENGKVLGGRATDPPDLSAEWLRARAKMLKLLEVRGTLPPTLACPETGEEFETGRGTYARRLDNKTGEMKDDTAKFVCAADGTPQAIVDSIDASHDTAPIAPVAIQGYCPACDAANQAYGGRFFAPASDPRPFEVSETEWGTRKAGDLAAYWPTSELPFGHMTHQRQPLPQHGYTHFWKMFAPRQLLVHAELLRVIVSRSQTHTVAGDYVLGAFQRYLSNQCSMAFWHIHKDHFAPALSNGNYHPKAGFIEVGVFTPMGYGSWNSATSGLPEAISWATNPWELVSASFVRGLGSGTKSEKTFCGDPVESALIECRSATDLENLEAGTFDLVITDPPFEGLVHYSELADFFHVWLRLALKERYPELFGPEYSPKTLEVVANKARQPEDPLGFYKRLLTESWREAERILKPGGLMAFTFHHSEDAPWILVLDSLFAAGFYLEATYPIRSDETKGSGEFGSKEVEYDIIHVCRKRTKAPESVSWARMRREVLREVRQISGILELHQKAGLLPGDLKVIRRGKALEYFSRHYGKVFVDENKDFSVRDALIGINQLLDEESETGKEPPPVNAEPLTRQFLRLFDGVDYQRRDEMQKLLRGTTIDPKEYEERGWCKETQKVYHLTFPLEIAQDWYGRHRRRLTSDYDQAMVLIGASFPSSGINVTDTLNNPNFRPHAALGRLLKWHIRHAASQRVRDAASIASQLYATWESQHREERQQMKLFFDDVEGA